MTLTELLDVVKAAPDEQLRSIKLDLVAASAMVDARLASMPQPAKLEDDLTIQQAASEMGIHPRTAYKYAYRKHDPLPTVRYGDGQKGARRVPRVEFMAWRRREAERGR